MKKRGTAICTGLGLALLLAQGICSADSKAVDAVKSALHARYPDTRVEDVRPAPIPGWYEVFTSSHQLVYSDASGEHLFVGKLLDTRTGKDLAAETLEQRLSIDFQSLPLEQAIKIVRGSGARRLAVFEDPDCPYCQKLEPQLANLHDVTLYVFLFPLAELHPQARVHAHAIWCAPDRADAWSHWMLERKDPESADCTGDPIEQLQTLGAALSVTGTPTLFLPSGKRLEGVIPAQDLERLLALQSNNDAKANSVAQEQASSNVNKLSSRAAIVTP
jgi:thiol:disulfide interchange protein DsbC